MGSQGGKADLWALPSHEMGKREASRRKGVREGALLRSARNLRGLPAS
jgi:hypothetical protein